MDSTIDSRSRAMAANTSEEGSLVSTPREELLLSAREFERKPGEPIWLQIARSIEDQIIAGNLPSGTRLPTETQLASGFKVNRHTLRRALRDLVRKGLISATPRRGTIVSRKRIPFPIDRHRSFQDIISSAGRDPGAKVLNHSIGLAPKDMANWLGIAERSKVVDLQYLRVANEIPVCMASSWLPADRFEKIGELFERLGCLEQALAKLGVAHYSLHQTRITSRPSNPEEQELLEVSKGSTLLVVDSLFVDDANEPILASHNRFAADRIELVVASD